MVGFLSVFVEHTDEYLQCTYLLMLGYTYA